jgi:hypothetical protein
VSRSTRSRAVRGALLGVLLGGMASLPASSAPAPAAASLVRADSLVRAGVAGPTIRITGLTPTLAGPKTQVVVRGEVVNNSSAAIAAPTVRLSGSESPLKDRRDVWAWAGGTARSDLQSWDTDDLAGTIAPGASRAFVVRHRLTDSLGDSFAALPIALDAGGTQLPTFITYAAGSPPSDARLHEILLLPVTLRPHRAMFGDYGAARLDAWLAEIGPEGRLTQQLAAAADKPVIWAIDPTLIDAPADIPDARPVEAAAGAAWDRIGPEQKAEVVARRAFREALAKAVSGDDCTVLPVGDADLVAGVGLREATARLRSLVDGGRASGDFAGCRDDIVWPADGLLSTQRAQELAPLMPEGTIGALLGRASSTPAAEGAGGAAWRTADGVPVLAYDDGLSNALLDLGQDDEIGVVTGQRLLADSLAAYAQDPARDREILIAAPRGVDSTGLGVALSRLASAPWTRPAGLTELLTKTGDGDQVADLTPTEVGEHTAIPTPMPTDPQVLARPAMTSGRLAYLSDALDDIAVTAKVRVDGAEQSALWTETLDQLFSARWRADLPEFQGQMRRLRAAGATARGAVQVTPETINFFADTGRLQLTVTNNLDVALTGLKVVLRPQTGLLRVEQAADAVDIGPRSKAVVAVRATALAAGSVPIRASLSARDGSMVGAATTVTVRVRPTGDWIYWSMGGVAGILLVLGVARRRRRRAA